MLENPIKYKRFNYYTKSVFISILPIKGTKIDINSKPNKPDVFQEITVKHMGTPVFKYTRYTNDIDIISADKDVVAVSKHDSDDVKDFYNMLNKATVLREKYTMHQNDIRACARIAKITEKQK